MKDASLDLRLLLCALVLALAGGCAAQDASDAAAPAGPSAQDTAAAPADSLRADPPTATGGGRSVAERVADASLAARVKTALVEAPALRTFDFDPSVTDGRATLVGDVGSRALGRSAAEVAAGVSGVETVRNRLTVEGEQVAWASSASEGDDGRAEDGTRRYHTVQAGESLWAIADRYGTSVRRVRALNGLGTSGNIQPGERLVVGRRQSGGEEEEAQEESRPAAPAPSESEAAVADAPGTDAPEESEGAEAEPEEEAYHVVERGESLWAIARSNGITVARLKELNDLSGSGLMPGDRLRVE